MLSHFWIYLLNPMTHPIFIAVAGPPGSGKTTWINQFLTQPTQPVFYLCPGLGHPAIDLVHMGDRLPWVQLVPEGEAQQRLAALPARAVVYLEFGFQLDLRSPLLATFPWQRLAVLPPALTDSPWHHWADEIVAGNPLALTEVANPPELWWRSLSQQVIDPPSLHELLIELAGGAYGTVYRVKGIVDLLDGTTLYVDFLKPLPGISYTKLQRSRWVEGCPNRVSGLEVVGWNLEHAVIAQALEDSCLPQEALLMKG